MDATAAFDGPRRKSTSFAVLGVSLALLLSSHAVLVLAFGAVGIAGNVIFTAAILVAPIATIFVLNLRPAKICVSDVLFGVFCLTALASTLLNPGSATPKELALLCISLSAYPACRLISIDDIGGLQRAFVIVIGIIVCVGTVATLCALLQQWDSPHGKPMVFGFNAGPTYFLTTLGFLILVLTTNTLTARRAAVISALVFLPLSIFAASMVRFVFIVLASSILVALITADRRDRKFVGMIFVVFLLAMASGLVARSTQTVLLAEISLEESAVLAADEDQSPSCNMQIDARNSIAIRRALAHDALFLIPQSGPLGTGLDSFMKASCLRAEPHNSILQAMVEFGWIGGVALTLLIISSVVALRRLASTDDRARFVFCGLIYVVLLAMGYGRISQDVMLFAFLGMANGAVASVRACPPQPL